MNSSKSSFYNFLFSIGGVLAMFVLLAGIYVISHLASQRLDLTEGKLYTLSPGTKAILKKLDTPVQIRFYATQGRDMPLPLKTYAQRIEDLLNEYRKANPGNIQIKKFDPQPDSDAEDKAIFDGVEGQQINMGDKIYLGLAINMLDSTQQIPFLTPQRERLLEYDITRAIANVMNTKKPVLGIMSGLPVFGQQMNPMMMMQRQQGGQDPWVFISELKKDFEVREVPLTADKIDDEIGMLMVFHPKGITDKTLFAIDQFVLRGGKMLGFVDPFSIVDAQSAPQNNPLQAAASGGSTLDKLTKAWGLEYDGNKVLADTVFMSKINRGRGPENAPSVLSLTEQGINTNDVVTSQVDNISLLFPGAFSGTPVAGLTQTVLLQSSPQSQLVEKFMAQFSGEQVLKDFVPSNKEYALALRLTGKFKTAFPDGKPADTSPADSDSPEEKPAADTGAALKESTKETAVILVADTDLAYDAFAAQVQQLFGQRLIFPINGNLNLVQSMVEQMGGDENLIAIRSRATMNRPFTKIKKVEAEAEDRYRNKIKELEQGLEDAQTRLNELQQTKESGQRFILSPAQQAEIRKFQEKQVEVRKELKEVRKSLRRDIESMENKLKWTNILAMPFVVVAAGMVVAGFKRKRTAAR
ncbi:MAG: Gldg family protein [Verrucomicrobiales bacterium]